jgi:hypothetical protein
MTAKFTVSGTKTTITFEYVATTALIQSVIINAAEYLWGRGFGNHGTPEVPILFASLTNQQKLDIVDLYLKKVVLDLANTNKSLKAQDLTRANEEAGKYNIDGK